MKLADFGASTTISLGETEELSTIAGTPYFMAPEVFVSKYGRRGDIWAVGCTIIQMLTGDPPWKDRKLHSIVQLHVLLSSWVGIPPLTREIPEDLRDFLELCFEKNPKNRPTAEDLLGHSFLIDMSVTSSFVLSSFPCYRYEDKIDSLGSTSGIDIREQLERAARAIFHPDEDSEDIQGTTRRPQRVADSPRIPERFGFSIFSNLPLPMTVMELCLQLPISNPSAVTTPHRSPNIDTAVMTTVSRAIAVDQAHTIHLQRSQLGLHHPTILLDEIHVLQQILSHHNTILPLLE